MITLFTILTVYGVPIYDPIQGLDRWHEALSRVPASVDPALILSIAIVESRLNIHAVSPRGAVGPLQILPHIWAPNIQEQCRQAPRSCVILHVKAAVRAVQLFQYRCNWDLNKSLQAYNSGRCNGNPKYARDVLSRYDYIYELLIKHNERLR